MAKPMNVPDLKELVYADVHRAADLADQVWSAPEPDLKKVRELCRVMQNGLCAATGLESLLRGCPPPEIG